MAVDMKGKFITFEGSEGSGKSTQAALVLDYLKKKKVPATLLREPGGVKISEAIRGILLDAANKDMGDECETLLYMAARAQMVKEVLVPALGSGTVVLCDRFLDSTIAYQGYGNGVDVALIKELGRFATQGIVPDRTFLFDIETAKGLARTKLAKDRIELRPLDYHHHVRQGYLELARLEPKRIKVITVDGSKEDIFKRVQPFVDSLLCL
ncbi:MAG TPA: dTMP kinase [Candidatus Omnitrophota bacterium]|nr:dTMP kinase [Candidatus Omnitrophota bacterium]